jgi:membrane protease YdiL (CAAX protease family)
MTHLRVRPQAFFALTYLLSWAVWLPLLAARYNLGPWRIDEGLSSVVRLLGVLMPGTAALLLAALSAGRSGVRSVLGGLGTWRVGGRWWAAAALAQPALAVAIGVLYNALGGQPPVAPAAPLPPGGFVMQAFFLLVATLGEEIGWRGLALPALQPKHGPLAASLILGLVWATWHLPFWLLIGTVQALGLGYLALNYLFIVPVSVYITWFYNHGRSSLLLAVAFHVTFNLVNVLWLPVTSSVGAFAWLVAAEWAIVLLLRPSLAPRPGPIPVSANA